MARQVDKEKVVALEKMIKNMSASEFITFGTGSRKLVRRHSIINYLHRYNLFSEKDRFRTEEYVMECPFHTENTPSFSVNIEEDKCNCFSCGNGGRYFDFIALYETEVIGRSVTSYDIMEQVLREDKELAGYLGFNSVYTHEEEFDINNITWIKSKIDKNPMPKSYLEAQSWLSRYGKTSVQDAIRFVTLAQLGISPAEVYRNIMGMPTELEVEEASINYEREILNSEFENIMEFDFDIGE